MKKIPFGELDAFHVIVEVPQGGTKKYAYDSKLDAIKLSRVLYDGLKFPFNYGFIPQTESGDSDHLDAFVISTHPITRGTVVECRAIGIMEMLDHGKLDHKIMAVPISEHRLDDIQDITDMPPHAQELLKEFYAAAGRQWQRTIQILGFGDKNQARKELLRAQILE